MPLYLKSPSRLVLARAIPAISVAISFAGLGSIPAWAESDEFCQGYANKALEQFATGREAGCKDLNFPVWSTDFKHHYDWCRTVSEAEANKGAEQRVGVLETCRVVSTPEDGTIVGVDTMTDTSQVGGQAAPRSVTPIPIPKPQAQTGGGETSAPAPVPLPSIDPGIGGQTPSNVDRQ